jgi:hypothetical protein
VTITVTIDAAGRRMYQLGWTHCRPVPAVLFAVYALPPGIPVAQMNLGGIGSVSNPPPIPGCYPVYIGSDSEGRFGRQCPICDGYWRSDLDAQFCPYCGFRGDVVNFLTIAQQSYIQQWWPKLQEALRVDAASGEYAVDMDAVADAIAAAEKPAFYYAELSQQNRYDCKACGKFNDILGHFGYCTVCGTRNDLQELTDKTIPSLRDRINAGGPYEMYVKEAVAVFDSFVGQYVKQLVRIPMTPARKNRLGDRTFQNLQSVAVELKDTFDINILEGLEPAEVEFAKLKFHRRHVYEHRGGEADQKYIDDSGDKAVRVKQALRETIQSAHETVRIIHKMAANLHKGFHEIILVDEKPIKRHQERQQSTRKLSPNPSLNLPAPSASDKRDEQMNA